MNDAKFDHYKPVRTAFSRAVNKNFANEKNEEILLLCLGFVFSITITGPPKERAQLEQHPDVTFGVAVKQYSGKVDFV